MDPEQSVSQKRKDVLLQLQQKVQEIQTKLASGSSTLTPLELQQLSTEIQQLLPLAKAQASSEAALRIHDELDKVFVAEKVGYSCDLCEVDLASDPERPNATLLKLEEACVLACGHVYHFKCLKGTTNDLAYHSADPSCIFCLSSC